MRWPSAWWIVQTTRNLPALVNLREKVTLGAVFDLKPGPVTLCGTLPLHDHFTVSPFLIRRVVAVNRYFVPDLRTPTDFVAARATVADRATRPMTRTATKVARR